MAARGRALFHGDAPFAADPQVSGATLPVSAAACANCHGHRAEGRDEGGVRAPPVTAAALRARTVSRSPYATTEQVRDAVMTGRGADGRTLAPEMPRYPLTVDEARALLGYIDRVGTDADPAPGVSADSVTVVVVGPAGSADAPPVAVRAGLAAAIDSANAAGGVFGRRVTLDVVEWRNDAERASVLAALPGRADALAVLAPWLGATPPELGAARWDDLPWIAALGAPIEAVTDTRISYLLPSVAAQARAVLEAIDGEPLCRPERGIRVLARDPALTSLANRLERAVGPDPTRPSASVILLGRLVPPADVPCVGSLATLGVRTDARARLVVGVPMAPADDVRGAHEWFELGQAAGRIFIEALVRSGRDVDRASLRRAIDTLRDFEAAPGIRVSFSARQRHGLEQGIAIWSGESHEN
jgi:hypothetical protein